MKWLPFCAMIIAFSSGITSAYANHTPCPTQQTTVFFVNGVDVPKKIANDHKNTLRELVYAEGASENCVHFELAHVKDFTLVLDIGEAILQKTRELAVHFRTGLDMLFRSVVPESWFDDDVVAPRYGGFGADSSGDSLFNQLAKHVVLYREKLSAGHRVILVSHSQGGFYTNAAYTSLTGVEQAQTRLVAVVTPAALVADGGPNTRLTEDLVAFFAFPFALAANETNDEPCGDSPWFCHGFEESYLHGTNSRTKIVADIIALLPQTIPSGTVQGFVRHLDCLGNDIGVLPNTQVNVFLFPDGEDSVAETISDENGFFTLSLPPGDYSFQDGSGTSFAVSVGEITEHDAIVGDACPN
ncbi:MAG: hypothetical protein HYT94_05240 [Parcubacteria group bacterium]|nr:hypothetical protein [Parcubacteria group bacterium]